MPYAGRHHTDKRKVQPLHVLDQVSIDCAKIRSDLNQESYSIRGKRPRPFVLPILLHADKEDDDTEEGTEEKTPTYWPVRR